MTFAKYALHPGPVTSKTDGDRHFIDARTLAFLYRVRPSECVVVPWQAQPRSEREHQLLLERIERMDLVHLYPRLDGNYTLPSVQPVKEATP
jgi:hypothetical protein